MLKNLIIPIDRIHILLCNNVFNMKTGICMLETSTATCFIHTFQLINKDSLFSESIINVLVAMACQTVGHFNHFSTACNKLKNIQVTLGSTDLMQKTLLLV